jgi:hypothetical protein
MEYDEVGISPALTQFAVKDILSRARGRVKYPNSKTQVLLEDFAEIFQFSPTHYKQAQQPNHLNLFMKLNYSIRNNSNFEP